MKTQSVLMTLLLVLGASQAHAWDDGNNRGRVITVDDDGEDCKNPDATTIQEGVNLARPGDTVRVCEGTYRGGISVNTEQIKLDAKGAVTVVLEPAIASFVFAIFARQVEIKDFEIVGVRGVSAQGISVVAPDSRLIDNTIHDFVGAGSAGIAVFFTDEHLLECNHVFDNTFSIFLLGVNHSKLRKNNVHENSVGISLNDANNNQVTQNHSNNNAPEGQGDGIFLCGASAENKIQDNRVNKNGRDGISVSFCTPGGPAPSENLIKNNRMRGNGTVVPTGVDARDDSVGDRTAGTANTWKNNECRTDRPDGLCDR